MNKKRYRSALREAVAFVLALTLPLVASAQTDATWQARLADGNILLADPDPVQAKFAVCQPLKGERVTVFEVKSGVGGMPELAHVIVAEGRCKGTKGWVGMPRLEAAQ